MEMHNGLFWKTIFLYKRAKCIQFLPKQGKYYSNHGGFVMEEYLMGFDATFFGFTEMQVRLVARTA